MDIVLELIDTFVADHVYAYLFPIGYVSKTDTNVSAWTWQPATTYFHVHPSQAAYMSSMMRDNLYRQTFTIFFATWYLACINYFVCATLSYCLLFDRRYLNHPLFLKNQIWLEMRLASISMPFMSILMTPWILLEIRGFAKLYDATADGPGWWYNILHIALFVLWTDFWNYWTHRLSHHPRIYKHFLYNHKRHHDFVISTPFAGYAIHPVEGLALAIPYFIFPFIFPVQKFVRVALYGFGLVWSIVIHDGEFLTTNRIVNGAACHSLHHLHRKWNFGQYFTLFDRLFGTYRSPEHWMFEEKSANAQLMKEASETNRSNDKIQIHRKHEANGKFE